MPRPLPGPARATTERGHVLVRVAERTLPPEVDVDDQILVGGHLAEDRTEPLHRGLQLRVDAAGRHDAEPLPFEAVGPDGQALLSEGLRPELLEVPDPVVAPRQDLEVELPGGGRRVLEPRRKEALERLGAVEEPLDPLGAVSGQRLRDQVSEVLLDLLVDAGALAIEDRLVEGLVAELPGDVGERREAVLDDTDEAVEERPVRRVLVDHARNRSAETPLEDREDRLHLLLHPLARLPDPEHGLPQLGGLLQVRHAVMREGPREPREEPFGNARGLPGDRPQVGEEVLSRRDRLPLFGAASGRLPPEERRNVGEGRENLVFGEMALVAVGSDVRGGVVLGHHPLGVGRVGVEAEDEAADLVEVSEDQAETFS